MDPKQYKNADIVVQGRKYPCLECDRSFRRKGDTRKHMEREHNATFVFDKRTTRREQKRRRELLLASLENPDTSDSDDTRINNTNRKVHKKPTSVPDSSSEDGVSDTGSDMAVSVISNNDNQPTSPVPGTSGLRRTTVPNDNSPDRTADAESNEIPTLASATPNVNQAYLDMQLYVHDSGEVIRRRDHIISCMSYAERHKISTKAFLSLIKLVGIHLPAETHIDTQLKRIQNMVGFNEDDLKKNHYCQKCQAEWNVHLDTCSNVRCNHTKSDYFVTDDMVTQLRMVLMRDGIWEKILEQKDWNYDTETIRDIYDGNGYRELKQPGKFLHGRNNTNLTFTVFHDGVSLYRSTNVSMWPLFMVINELPRNIRFNQENIILFAMWQSTHSKPSCKHYFGKFKEAMEKLYNEGITITIDNTNITVKFIPLIFTQDLAARAFMLIMRSHGAEKACHLCTIDGESLKMGKKHSRHYDPLELNVRDRVFENIKEAAAQGTYKKAVEGFYGYSPVLDLPYFNQWSVVIDYMHNNCIGIPGKLHDAWFEQKNCLAYIGDKKDIVAKRVMSVKPSKQITRLPKGLNYKDWKAFEQRSFTLIYSLFSLEGVLSDDHLAHYALFVEGTFLILKEEITSADLQRAKECFTLFVTLYERLYANPDIIVAVTLNMHNLTHLPDCVDKFGPAGLFSTFPMESRNGTMKSSASGTSSVKHQLFWKSYMTKICASHMSSNNDRVNDFIAENQHQNEYNKGVELRNCKVIGRIRKNCSREEKRLIRSQLHTNNFKRFRHAEKILVNGTYFDSKSCTRIKMRCTHYIEMKQTESNEIPDIVCVDSYVISLRDNSVYALGKAFKYGPNIVPGYAPNCRYMEDMPHEPKRLYPVELFAKPVIQMTRDGKRYVSLLPNTYEHD